MTAGQGKLFDSPLAKARELKARRQYESALRLLEQALGDRPDDRRLKASLADLHFRMQHPRRALALAGEILREDPDDPRALVVMGNGLLARDKPAEALEYFKLALRVAPTDYLLGRVARCQLGLGRPQAALSALNQAEAYAPPSARLLGLRAACYRMLGEPEAERQVLLAAARAAPADHQGFFTFVWPLLSELSPRQSARVSSQLRQAPEQEHNPHLLIFEADNLLKSRDRPGARQRLDHLRTLDLPENVRLAVERLGHQVGQTEEPAE